MLAYIGANRSRTKVDGGLIYVRLLAQATNRHSITHYTILSPHSSGDGSVKVLVTEFAGFTVTSPLIPQSRTLPVQKFEAVVMLLT